MNEKQPTPNSLRFYRKQAGLRQVDVAAKLGFTSYDRISHWEQGIAFPNVTNLFRLAALYNVSAEELYLEYTKSVKGLMHDQKTGNEAEAKLPVVKSVTNQAVVSVK